MWCDDLLPGTSWTVLWRSLIICTECGGIRHVDKQCSACGDPGPCRPASVTVRTENGTERQLSSAFMGAEGRIEDYTYLKMLEREWKRPILESDIQRDDFYGLASPRAAIVLLFWTYFETRIERLLRKAMQNIPDNLTEDTLRRYSFIGSRLDRLYQILFDTTYFADLKDLGYQQIADYLAEVQRCRNDFSHGKPGIIDDILVKKVVDNLGIEHEAWIAVFNRRAIKINF